MFTGQSKPSASSVKCPFPDCHEYEAQGGCNIVLHQQYDGNRGDIMRCKTCGRTFSSRRHGIMFKSRIDEKKVEEIIEQYHLGASIRETARLLKLNRGTVRRYFQMLEKG